MTQLKRVAFIGNSLPRRCGIATFTSDLHKAVESFDGQIQTGVLAMNDDGRSYEYPSEVKFQIRADILEDYIQAADFLNAEKYDVVSLQHEFGIFGGDAGAHVLALLTGLDMPVVATFHTILSHPTPAQRSVLCRIAELSAIVVVMAEKARELLRTVYDVPAEKIEVVPHGSPLSLYGTRPGKGQAWLHRQARDPDLWASLAKQRHRSCDRRNAIDPEKPA